MHASVYLFELMESSFIVVVSSSWRGRLLWPRAIWGALGPTLLGLPPSYLA